jgi:hypothetical protein
VSPAVWGRLVQTHRQATDTFLRGPGFQGDNTDGNNIRHGVLASLIGGVFNVASQTGRRDAFEWAQQRSNAWSRARRTHRLNSAIFDIGPGTAADRQEAAELLDLLTSGGENLTDGQMEFTVVRSENSTFLLARVIAAGAALEPRTRGRGAPRRENPLAKLRLGFSQPKNVAEVAREEEQMQDVAKLDQQPPQSERMTDERDDTALELALLADAVLNHMPRLAAPTPMEQWLRQPDGQQDGPQNTGVLESLFQQRPATKRPREEDSQATRDGPSKRAKPILARSRQNAVPSPDAADRLLQSFVVVESETDDSETEYFPLPKRKILPTRRR